MINKMCEKLNQMIKINQIQQKRLQEQDMQLTEMLNLPPTDLKQRIDCFQQRQQF